MSTYGSVGGLLLLVTLLVGRGLGGVRLLLLVAEGLPVLAELLADLACEMLVEWLRLTLRGFMTMAYRT